MDKIKLNNQIISMRKLVKQGKIHIIGRLVKEVKLLKTKKGSEAQIAKYQRKAGRILSEINIIKKINVDSVSKLCLCSDEEDWKSKISDNNMNLEDRAMARLANFGAVRKEVISFRTEFPRLAVILPDLIQQWEEKKQQQPHNEKKLRTSDIKKRKKENLLKLKEKNTTTEPFSKIPSVDFQCSNDLNFKSRNNKESDTKENNHKEDSPTNFLVVARNITGENLEISSGISNKNYHKDEKEILWNDLKESHGLGVISRTSESSEDRKTHNSDEYQSDAQNTGEWKADSADEYDNNMIAITNQENSVLEKNISKTFCKTKMDIKPNASGISNNSTHVQKAKVDNGLKVIKSLNLEELAAFDLIPIDQKHVEENVEMLLDNTEIQKRDPFFLGSDGDDCEESNEESDSETKDLVLQSKKYSMQNSNQRISGTDNGSKFSASGGVKRFGNKYGSSNQSFRFKQPKRNSNNNIFISNKSKQSFGSEFVKNGKSSFNSSHQFSKGKGTSYANKRDHNFGNKSARKDNRKCLKFNTESVNDKFPRKKNSFHSSKDEKKEAPLHPSWEAKRKQNAMTTCIVPFQGKKIKFED